MVVIITEYRNERFHIPAFCFFMLCDPLLLLQKRYIAGGRYFSPGKEFPFCPAQSSPICKRRCHGKRGLMGTETRA